MDLSADKSRALALVPVSRETEARLDHVVACLLLWQERMNLVAASTLGTLWTRHIADSLQLLALAPQATKWLDLGSGAGFPGLVVACALAERPGAAVHLVESNQRKAAFLREAARAAGAPVQVHAQRIEDVMPTWSGETEVVTARALAPLGRLLGLASRPLRQGAQGLFPKGQTVEAELTEAAKYWRIDAATVPSVTDSRGRIVVVRRAQRIEK